MDATAALPFPKFAILPSELRSHIISYNSHNTLAKYAVCSKVSNMDIQQYNTRPPCHIIFHHGETSARVELTYKRANKSKFKYSTRFTKSDRAVESGPDKAPCEAAIKYVLDRFKYVKTGKCALLEFYGKFYLSELSTIAQIQKFNWLVAFYESMYPKFYDSVKNEKNERMCFRLLSKSANAYNIPVEFFQTEFFQNLAGFECTFVLPGLQDREFLTMKAYKITMDCSSISDRAINQKIQQWASNPSFQPVDYNLFRSINYNSFDKSVILENLHLTDRHTHRYFGTIQHSTRPAVLLYDFFSGRKFRTSSFS